MAFLLSVGVLNRQAEAVEAEAGASAVFLTYGGTLPANEAAADSGSALSQDVLPADYLSAGSGGTVSKVGTWSITGTAAAGAGTNMTHFRIKTAALPAGAVAQGTIGIPVTIATNALTAANGNVLNFASTTGVVVGMKIEGTGVVAGSKVVAVTGTTVTMSHTSTAGVASAASITFRYDMDVDNVNIANGQTGSVGTFTYTATN